MHTLRAPIDVPLLSGSATPLPQVCRPHVSAAPLADSSYHVAVDNTVCVVGSDVPLCMRVHCTLEGRSAPGAWHMHVHHHSISKACPDRPVSKGPGGPA